MKKLLFSFAFLLTFLFSFAFVSADLIHDDIVTMWNFEDFTDGQSSGDTEDIAGSADLTLTSLDGTYLTGVGKINDGYYIPSDFLHANRLRVSSTELLDPLDNTDWMISFWHKPSAEATVRILSWAVPTATYKKIVFHKSSGTVKVYYFENGGATVYAIPVTAGVWTHIGMVHYANGTMMAYQDGTLSSTISSLTDSNWDAFLKIFDSVGTTYNAGTIDEVVIRNSSNIANLLDEYNSGDGKNLAECVPDTLPDGANCGIDSCGTSLGECNQGYGCVSNICEVIIGGGSGTSDNNNDEVEVEPEVELTEEEQALLTQQSAFSSDSKGVSFFKGIGNFFKAFWNTITFWRN